MMTVLAAIGFCDELGKVSSEGAGSLGYLIDIH
jgi:hypothetical protein